MGNDAADKHAVHVIETIPVGGDHAISPEEIGREKIPTPDHLRLSREIGRGGAGRVHVALDRHLLRHVALKRLDAKMAEKRMYRDGFVAEAQITGQLEHSNIVPVHELAIAENGVPYFTMKLVRGESFKQWLAEPWRVPGSPERLEQGLEIMIKVCDALAYAHHRGVIHRDLKSGNIMVGEFGQVYLVDWGLARLTRTRPASGSRSQMDAKGPVGTPTHFAPEQARGIPEEMDERSDVFGVGALLYELVSGLPPYGRSRTVREALDKALAGEVIPLADVTKDIAVPAGLVAIVMRAVAVNPDDRYPSIVALQTALRRVLHGGLHLPSRSFEPGDDIIVEGDLGEEAFMITRGRCRVFHNVDGGEVDLTTLVPGDVFGEMALLLDAPRAATVQALEAVTVTVLERETMNQGVGANAWTQALVRSLAARFRDLEEQMRASGLRGNPIDDAS